MNAQTIQDNVNKYRFGVLVGNFAEERFGQDQAERHINEQIPISTMKATFGLKNSALASEPSKQTAEEKEYYDHVVNVKKGVQQHLLFGHAIQQPQFEKREFGTSYDLSYNQQIKPQQQIWSKFTPDPSATAKPYNKNTLYEKSYQSNIPEIGGKPVVPKDKVRPYNESTKFFDSTHVNIPFRK